MDCFYIKGIQNLKIHIFPRYYTLMFEINETKKKKKKDTYDEVLKLSLTET